MALDRIKEIAQIAYKDYATKEDVGQFFKNLLSAVQETRRDLTAKIEARLAEIRQPEDGYTPVKGKDYFDGKDGYTPVKGKDYFDGKTPVKGIDYFDGEPGQNADPATIVEEVATKIPAMLTGEDVRNPLEALQGEERLKLEAIRGLEEIIADIKALKDRPVGGAGRALLQLYVNGSKKGAVQYLNITGAGVSYASANGRNDVTITGSGGALSVLTATGDVDDSNTSFTFVSEPTLINVNGATYVDGHGCTISGTSVTLDNPAGTGGFVYGLG